MDVQKKLDEIVSSVSSARSMPMSASCVVNRAELLAMLEEVRAALPGSLAQAQELIGDREQLVDQARQEADRIIRTAHEERGSLISDTEVARRSQSEADRILTEARKEAEDVRAEADDYVDSKLANFEVVLTKTLGSVGRGREKLLGTGPGLDDQGYEDEDAPERSHDPETLRVNADKYVDVKLGAFEAVLAKTLEAVGRGRQTLHGRIASDDLGALGQDDDGTSRQHTSDADFLAGLAAVPDAPAEQARAADIPAQQQYGQQDQYGYQQPADPYGGYQQAYAQQQDQYGYQSADPYAYQAYDGSQAAYDPAQDQQGYAQQEQQQSYALDETSLFDTGMISAEQLRAYEQGRGGQ
ncbi:cell division initiation protein [Streptomyces sp. WI04-05B]|uniref:cell division initiation protein n=1 Tax=Streptomyces TaxID=1883 RepID=UPI0029A5B98E|nr:MULTISPECIES: cell division initiation protein [unclassified Streptomyces]MDX2541905.1 cell division initiation protein [Streptomyces sp. WI04-05B]MDX2586987.1 cell division initiation protein [Streptomyces sp. WI04-05A]MDX3749955.1 cell division initiation protein [Streptomyces sp. AK08-02]